MQNSYYDPFNNNGIPLTPQQETKVIDPQLKAKQKKELIKAGLSLGFAIMLSLVLQNLAVMLLQSFNLVDKVMGNSVLLLSFNSIAVTIISLLIPFGIVAAVNKKYYVEPLVPNKKVGFWGTFKWVNFGVFVCLLANMLVGLIITLTNKSGYDLQTPETPKIDSIFGCVLVVISSTILPAICEEFSMRCCAMGLLRKHGKAFSIFAVSIIFGSLHGNVVQFIFAFLVGLVLAFVTVKTDSIIPAILIHGINNSRSAIYDICEYSIGVDGAEKAISYITIYFFIAGVISTILLFLSNNLTLHEERRPDDVLPFGKKLLYILPGLSVPLLLLVLVTITTITKL